MVERKVTVNPRASAVVITNNPKHITVNRSGIENLKTEVSRCFDLKKKKKMSNTDKMLLCV